MIRNHPLGTYAVLFGCRRRICGLFCAATASTSLPNPNEPPRLMPRHAQLPKGFTLVETLVALAVVAIALTAGLQATGSLTRLSERQQAQLLAQLCAENQLAKVRLAKTLPGIGTSNEPCTQAGQALDVAIDVLPTPNPNFRRVDVRVKAPVDASALRTAEAVTLLQVSTVVGRF